MKQFFTVLFTLLMVPLIIASCNSGSDGKSGNVQNTTNITEVSDTSDIGPGLVGASFTDKKGNEIEAYIPDSYSYSDIKIQEELVEGDSGSYEFTKITYPEGISGRQPIVLKTKEKIESIIVYNNKYRTFELAPFVVQSSNSIKLITDVNNHEVALSLSVNENE